MEHKLRSLLSVLGVVCGVMAVMSMISIGEGAKEKVLKEIEGLGLTNIYISAVSLTTKQEQDAATHHSFGITMSDMERLQRQQKYVKKCRRPSRDSSTSYRHKCLVTPKVVQVTPNYFQIAGLSLGSGRLLLSVDEDENHLVCVLGTGIALQLGKDGRVGSQIRVGASLFRVVGILAEQSIRAEGAIKIAPDNL